MAAERDVANYWILDWIDGRDIRTFDDAEKVLRARAGVSSFVEAAREDRKIPFPRAGADHQLLAGPSMDLSGNLECQNPACMTANVEHLLRKAVLYFDRIVVTGLEPTRIEPLLKRRTSRPLVNVALLHTNVALKIRELGAERVLVFSPKAALCTEHLNQHAVEAGMSPVAEQVELLADRFATGGKFLEFRWHKGKLSIAYAHPDRNTVWTSTRFVKPGEKPNPATEALLVAEDLARRHVGEVIRSAASAKMSGAALGMVGTDGYSSLTKSSVSVEQVALHLPLPLTDVLPIRELLALREGEAEAFQSFQAALRLAIKEQLKVAGSDDAVEIAEEVMRDVVDPALVSIDRRIASAANLSLKTTLASGGVGLTMLTVGLIASAPIVVPGVVIGASGLALSLRERFKAQSEIELEDMYFLWRASQAADHAHP